MPESGSSGPSAGVETGALDSRVWVRGEVGAMKLDGEGRWLVGFEMVLTARRDRDTCARADSNRLVGFIIEHKRDGAGVDDESAPNAVRDSVGPQEPSGDGRVVEHVGRADVFNSEGKSGRVLDPPHRSVRHIATINTRHVQLRHVDCLSRRQR
jgi:hypothetical protein